tara:strand:- start:25 stop:618 length:594 start_codon:yes stop_codon:yes gene_type:complete
MMNTAEQNKISKTERLITKIKKNNKAIIIFFTILLSVLFTYLYLKELDKKRNIKISNDFNYARILSQKEKNNDSKNLFYKIINQKNDFYSPLSLYLVIENNLENDPQTIIKLFDKIISIKKISNEDKNLIKIKKALFLIEKNIGEQEILDELKPIINSESIWKKEATKLVADYYLNKGDTSKSKEFYKLLKNTQNKK